MNDLSCLLASFFTASSRRRKVKAWREKWGHNDKWSNLVTVKTWIKAVCVSVLSKKNEHYGKVSKY